LSVWICLIGGDNSAGSTLSTASTVSAEVSGSFDQNLQSLRQSVVMNSVVNKMKPATHPPPRRKRSVSTKKSGGSITSDQSSLRELPGYCPWLFPCYKKPQTKAVEETLIEMDIEGAAGDEDSNDEEMRLSGEKDSEWLHYSSSEMRVQDSIYFKYSSI